MYLIAGPCSIENEKAIEIAKFVKQNGGTHFRGMLFKPRSSPESFQGLGEEGLEILEKCRKILPVVTEVMDKEQIEIVRDVCDIYQVGARNCQNFSLLKELGKEDKPVIFKRGFGVKIKEWIAAAEYLNKEGIIFCERGIRTFEDSTRFTFDINAIPVMKEKGLTIIADPSHAAGERKYVPAIAKAALAAGADGLLIEVHPKPEEAKSDTRQQLNFEEFSKLMVEIKAME